MIGVAGVVANLSSGKPVVLGSGKTDSGAVFSPGGERTSSAHFLASTVVAGRRRVNTVGWTASIPRRIFNLWPDIRLAHEAGGHSRKGFIDLPGQARRGAVSRRVSAGPPALGRDESRRSQPRHRQGAGSLA